MKILVFIVIASIQVAAAAVGFFLLLIGMNGYSERQATPSLILYIVLSLTSALGLGAAGLFAVKRLVGKRSWGALAASAVTVIGSSALGVILLLASLVAAIALAEVLRGMRA